ncbi:hypothetical protein [Actinophytocola sp. NPDC049390]|uniref:hypothetical protein n=1 Tax=Actinophytocola sp. NPDC049390 TaxID=3363894 RepID=UPI0037A7E22C
MPTLGMFEDDDYLAESGTLVVRDAGAREQRGPFSQHGSDVQPCGTIVRTGNGWLEGAAGPGPDVVRIEVHDSAPDDDFAERMSWTSRTGACPARIGSTTRPAGRARTSSRSPVRTPTACG